MVTSVFSGAVFAMQMWEGMDRYGSTTWVGWAVALAITREMVPILAALMVSGRAGSAMQKNSRANNRVARTRAGGAGHIVEASRDLQTLSRHVHIKGRRTI